MLDYLQLITPDGDQRNKQRYEVVGEQSRMLKGLAKECGLPFVILAQLGREAENCSDGFKMVRHLRESGNIEQDADLICILSRPDEKVQEAAKKAGGNPEGSVTLSLAKHRNGPTGEVKLHFDKHTQRFLSYGDAYTPKYTDSPIPDSAQFDEYVEEDAGALF